MTDQQQQPGAADDQTPPAGATGQPQEGSETRTSSISDLATALKVIDDLRNENAKHRKSQKAAEKLAQEANEARLAGEKKWEELAESRRVELEKLKPVAEQYESITAAFNASLDNRLKQIPEDIRKKTVDPIRASLSPVDFSNWLDANMDILRARQAPPLDGGAGSTASSGKTLQLTPDQIEMAKASGMPLDEYAKYLQRVQENKGSAWTQPK